MKAQSVAVLLQALGHNDPEVRQKAAHDLAEMGQRAKAAVPALLRALDNDKDEQVRGQAATALGRIGLSGNETIPVLARKLCDKRENEDVRSRAASALKMLRALSALTGCLKEEDLFVRRKAAGEIHSLFLWRGPEAERPVKPEEAGSVILPLVDILKDSDEDVRSSAAGALGEIGSAAQPILSQALRDANPLTRVYSADAILHTESWHPDKDNWLKAMLSDNPYQPEKISPLAMKAIQTLAEAMEDSDVQVRRHATSALIGIGSYARPALQALLKNIDDTDREVRLIVASSVADIDPKNTRVVPTLIKGLRDNDELIRNMAASSLSRPGVDVKPAIPFLIQALSDESEEVRVSVAEVLGRLGFEAKEAIPALKEAIKKSEIEDFRKALSAALRRIQAR